MLSFDPHDLAGEELRHVYRGRRSGGIIVLFSGAVAAGLLAWDIGGLYAGIWYLWLLAAHAWHWWIGRSDWTSGSVSVELANINRHVTAAALAGLGWGAIAIALPWLGRSSKAAILIIMLITVIMALPRLVVFLPIFFAFAAGVYVPLLLATPFLDFETQHMVVVMLVVVGATLWASAREVRKILIEVLLKQISSEQASWVDRLTGIGNRRRFDDKLDTAWRQALRAKVPLSLIMVDVDHFKKFNDKYGHQAGDVCLRQVAGALDGCARRAGDSVTRYGGEEFAVVLFHTSMNEARNISENMLAAVRAVDMKHEESPHEIVTISVGGATIVPFAESSMEQLVEEADKSLYRAKANGRNRAEWRMLSDTAPSDIRPG
ncbi:Phytochrome-like protein cph2 [Methylophilaceae bacterium]|nr:Phytochrome-like protein cph2 [Methylophilaceae bacterium]